MRIKMRMLFLFLTTDLLSPAAEEYQAAYWGVALLRRLTAFESMTA